jgi:wyosine [tRNA(Phe)-imidazoG37] synthetase (radical SAM superfamily)
VVACMQLKKDIESARGLAVATGIITPAQLPASCRNLKRPDQVHTNLDQWSMSWTDLPMRHKRTGLIK